LSWRWILPFVLASSALPETLYWASSRVTTTPTPIAPINPSGPSFTVPFPDTAATSGITISVQAPETIPGATLNGSFYRIDPALEITVLITGTMLSGGTGPNFVFRGIGGNSCGANVNRNLNSNIPFTRTVTCRYSFEIRSPNELDLLFHAESGSARVDIRLNYVLPRDRIFLTYNPNASGQQASFNPTPDPSRPLDLAAAPREGYVFCGHLTTSLGSRDRAEGALRVVDQSGILVASSDFFAVTRSGFTTSARRCTAPARIPASVTLLRMKGVLIDPRLPSDLQTIEESSVVEYRVATPPMRLTNVTPRPEDGLPRGTTVSFSGVVENYPSISNTALALRLFDKDRDGVLLGSSDFVSLAPGQTAPVTLEIRNFDVGKEVQDVFIKAVLIHEVLQQVVAETEFTRYAPDVSIDRLELVQVVQTEAHDVPLIAGKPTLMRVFVKQAGQLDDLIPQITANIRAVRGLSELTGTATPLNLLGSIRAHPKPDRNREGQSLNYLLPQNWVPRDSKEAEVPYSYEVELLLPRDRPEGPKSSNHNRDKPLMAFYQGTFESPRPFRIALVNVCIGDAPNAVCPKSSLHSQLDYLRRVYPLNFHSVYVDPGYELSFSNNTESLFLGDIRISNDIYRSDGRLHVAYLLHRMNLRASLTFPLLLETSSSRLDTRADLVVGYMPQLPDRAGQRLLAGQAFPEQMLPVVLVREGSPVDTLAHEVGHILGLYHPRTDDGCGAKDSAGRGMASEIGDPGFDVLLREGDIARSFKAPDTKELMTWCNGLWISAQHFKLLHQRLSAVRARVSSTPSLTKHNSATPGSRTADSDTFLLVNGVVTKDGAGVLHDSYQTAVSDGLSVHEPNGGYCLQFHGDSGPLTGHCFNPSIETGDGPTEVAFFSRVIPFPEGATRLTLLRGDAELATVRSGAARPTVEFVSPSTGSRLSGSVTIGWSGSDPSGAPLSYALQYSNDGAATWRPLPVAAISTQFHVEAGQLLGPSVHFRILVSNGLYSSGAIAGPFDIVQNARLDPPPAAIDFGNLQAGVVRQISLRLTNTGTSLLELRSVTSDSPEFELSTGVSFLGGGSSESLPVLFAPRQAGTKQARLTIETNDPSNPRHMINLTGAAFHGPVPSITAPPSLLDFGTVASGQTKDLEIVIGNSGNADLNVASLAFSSAVFSAVTPGQFRVAPGAEARVTIRFRPAAAGTVNGMLTINSDDPTRGALRIPLTAAGSGGGTPQIEVTPAALAFGDVSVGQNRELDAVVRNTGNAMLGISGITSSNPRFTLVTPAVPFTVPAGGQQSLRVRFSPAAAGSQTGNLTIASNDPARAAVAVSLSGNGIQGTGPPEILSVDDGTFESVVGFPQGGFTGFFVNRLTPSRYPATLRAVRILFPAGELPVGTAISVLTAAHPSGSGGSPISGTVFQSTAGQVSAMLQFIEYTVPPITITSGDFLVGFSAVNPANVFPAALDRTPPARQRSYIGTSAGSIRFLSAANDGNLAIRARID